MLNFLFKKETTIETLILKYLETFRLVQENFSRAFNECLEMPQCENFEFLIKQTHKFESKADDIMAEINELMYGKALIPDSRGDIRGLMDAVDRIPHKFELVLYTFQTQKIEIPKFLVNDIQELANISFECCDLVVKQVTNLLGKGDGIRALMSVIDTHESHCDHLERGILTKIFDSDIDPFLKLQIKDLVIQIGDISNQADRVSKRINIVRMKRRV